MKIEPETHTLFNLHHHTQGLSRENLYGSISFRVLQLRSCNIYFNSYNTLFGTGLVCYK